MKRLVTRLAIRATGLWIGVRAVLLVVASAAELSVGASPGQGVAVAGLVTLLFAVDLGRRGERVFLANLGVSRRALVVMTAAVAAGLELAAAGIGALAADLPV